MKKILMTIMVMSILLISLGFVFAAKPTSIENGVEKGWEKQAGCTTIQEGTLLASTGDVIPTGFDDWGYNYQAHMFRGGYCDSYRDAEWCRPYADVNLIMKWNDGWMSNTDCNGDGDLDRHPGFNSYIGSGAWLTNHQSGVNDDGTHWEYFIKIVAKSTADFDCTSIGGEEIWGQFCTIQTVSNDPAYDEHGVQLLADISGFGFYNA